MSTEKSHLLPNGYTIRQTIVDELRLAVVELICTTIFQFIICTSVVAAQIRIESVNHGLSDTPLLIAGLVNAFGVVFVVSAFGPTSGGFINPAVTIVAGLGRKISWRATIFFVVAQLAGSTLGAALTFVMIPNATSDNFGLLGGFAIQEPFNATRTYCFEILLTGILVFIIQLVALDPPRALQPGEALMAPFVIGLTVGALVITGGYLSGACMNPARAFGPAVLLSLPNSWIFMTAPVCGGVLSFLFHQLYKKLLPSVVQPGVPGVPSWPNPARPLVAPLVD
eukprot:TRINITY_DN5978_c0_g1_i2.p1 TRINITY_DN5978_c0_g1~~TRINITY_DN5978_c0_g1_i2.p1  ORF type:complete len:282 (-),score=36.13 TRINITY_DN5978_c0_g1_i2:220-1065(-)